MADDKDQSPPGAVPVAGGEQKAVPEPAPPFRYPTAEQAAPDTGPGETDPRAKAAALRKEAAQLESGLTAVPGTVQVKVAPPHALFEFAELAVSSDFTPVPAGRLATLEQAAANSGVTLITEG